ncbi:hypothetical protein DOY81_014679, partial [Sarcophaga bullata]
ASDMLKERFEVVCMLEGVIESTGMTTQARSKTGEYEVDYTLFNNTYDVDTPLCSAKELDDLKEEYSRNNKAGLERALTVGLMTHISSAASVDHLDPASDESLDSARLHIRSNSIPNGALAAELEPLNNNNKPSFVVGGSVIVPTITTNFQSINELKNSNTNLTPSPFNNNNNNNTSNNNNNNNNNNSSNNSTNNVHSSSSSNSSSNLKKSTNNRRLSIKQDQLPLDSLC